MNWSRETQGWVGMAVLVAVFVACLVWAASNRERLRQYEVVLGDGTKATCVVVQGVRAAGVTCVPHIVLGPDAEEDKP
jgi:hypothetical protein